MRKARELASAARPSRSMASRTAVISRRRLREREQQDAHRPGRDLRAGALASFATGTRKRRSRSPTTPTYGLAGGVWSKDSTRAERVAAQIRTGTMWINDYHVFNDLAPFGGYKQSGIGRELGLWGLEEYTEVKHVHVGAEGQPGAQRGHSAARAIARTTALY